MCKEKHILTLIEIKTIYQTRSEGGKCANFNEISLGIHLGQTMWQSIFVYKKNNKFIDVNHNTISNPVLNKIGSANFCYHFTEFNWIYSNKATYFHHEMS